MSISSLNSNQLSTASTSQNQSNNRIVGTSNSNTTQQRSSGRDSNLNDFFIKNKVLLELLKRLLVELLKKLENTEPDRSKPFMDEFSEFDASNNNLSNTSMGALDSPTMYMIPTDTTRTIGGSAEVNMSNPRDISNVVMAQSDTTQNSKGLSDMFWLWGQFLDHDITLSADDEHNRADITIPTGDSWFDPQWTGAQTMKFERTVSTTDGDGNPIYSNAITAYIDGSNVYGSNKETADKLRTFEGGHLISSENNLLPENENGHFLAGDVRANENVGLTAMHTLWMREHNRIADVLATENPHWDDEILFQEARKEVIAQMQAITYNEFLPNLLGNNGLSDYSGYQTDVSAQISNAFATAAYRLGHTMISPTIKRLDENGQEIAEGNLQLRDAFFRPDKVKEAGIDPVLRGFASQTAQAVDPMLIDDLRNFLFGPPGAGGFDLATLNIQRGRDHGLAGFNDCREALGLERITSFDDPVWKDGYGEKLATVYDSPDDIDLWVAGLAEKESGDSLVGETFSLILKDQFERLRDGDRFWYENRYSQEKVDQLNKVTLADIIQHNTDITNLQQDVMIAQPVMSSPVTAATPVPDSSTQANADIPAVIQESVSNSNIRTLDNAINNRP